MNTAAFWTRWQADAEPCVFPTLADSSRASQGTARLPVELEQEPLSRLIKSNESLEAKIALAWALMLKVYTGNASVSFGIVTGTATLCAAPIDNSDIVSNVLQIIKANIDQTRDHQASRLDEIPALKDSAGRLFCNTAISLGVNPIDIDSLVDIHLHCHVDELQLTAEVSYSRSCLEDAQAQDVAATFAQLFSQLVSKPDSAVSELEAVSAVGLDKLFAWNANTPASVNDCVGSLFYETAKLRSNNMAVRSSDDSFTYEELNALTNKLAHELQRRGVGPEVVVLLSFPKSAWAVVAMISVIRAGGTMLFLDASHPLDRLQEIQSQVKSTLMLTSTQFADTWQWTQADVIVVDRESLENLPSPVSPVTSIVTPENMLYIIFTSGSTGKPKGCVIEHSQFLTGSYAQRTASGMGETDRVLQLASFTFDVSILEILTSLIAGACVCIPGDAARAKGPASCIEEFEITWAFLTPSLVKLMAPEMVPNLRFLALGGEPLGKTDVETWAPHLQLANGYGPTECSIAATAYRKLNATTDPANIGYPLGAMCWIVDPDNHQRLMPVGAPGELLVHGPIVARGYFQDEVKTNAAFVEDFPWLPYNRFGASRRMYKTGDLARYNSDGTINFISRKDNQVKLRGLRIELGEIEHHVAIHELVRQAVVILPRQGPCKNQLTAILSLKQSYDETCISGALEHLHSETDPLITNSLSLINKDAADHLPAYMVPSVWIVVKDIPLTVSGKLNRVLVTKWTVGMEDTTYNTITGTESSLPASNPMEEQIQKLCSEVLDIPVARVHLNRSFVNNGGDSILGMKLLAKLREASIHVSIQDMIQSKTLSELAKRAETSTSHEIVAYPINYDMEKFKSLTLPHLGLTEDKIDEAYPLGPMQRGILLSQQRQAASYELRVVCELKTADGQVNLNRLKTAWQAVVNRHTSLRTIFVPSIAEDAPYDQVVLKQTTPYISMVVCKNQQEVSQAIRKHKIVAAANQPRVNFVVYETPEKTFCMAAVDHALIDGVSVLLLFQDLSAAYSGLLASEKTAKFSHYIGYMQQMNKEESLAYWRKYLAEINPTEFPILNDDIAESNELHELSSSFESGLELQAFCRKYGFTPASVIQTAWAMVLKAYTGLEDVAFGYLSAGRDAPVLDIEEAVGAYINMLICRLKLPSASKVIELVESVQDSSLEAMPHQHISLAEIQHDLQLREPLFNTVMSLQSALGEVIQANEANNSISFRIVDEVDPTEYDISVNIAISRESMHVNLRHYTSKISDAMAKNIFETFKHMIRAVLHNPDTAFGEVQVLSENDAIQIQAWNRNRWEDYESCVHELFSHQVALRPNATAIDAWDGSLTYQRLDELSTMFAAYLSRLGVGPEVLVPLSFKKSMWTPVAQMAVLKAGGACVAFDPAHPSKRREELIRQCDARIAVTAPAHGHLFEGLLDKVVTVDQMLMDNLSKDTTLPRTWEVASPNNPAFVVFTSGSTGKPKGIVLEHHALVTSAHAHGPAMKYGPDARILQFASYTFDVSIGETFTCLMLGGTLCIPNDEERMDDLAGVINRMNINVAYLTPSVAGILHPSDVPGLQVLALGGEAVRKENVSLWADKVFLVNIYGPAEASVWSTGLFPVPRGTPPSNIGYGLGALQWITQVGNPDKLCAIGCAGELLLEGPIVARGYLKDLEKTNAAFINDPAWLPLVNTVGGRRLYRTGDLAKYNSDGTISFIGRRDFQIKLHGQRIEMGEIEHNILSHDKVANAVVIYPKNGPLKERLTAIVSLSEFTSGDSRDEIQMVDSARGPAAAQQLASARSHLSERVPGYMMPAVWLMVQGIPLSVNGKTDRSRVSRWIEALEQAPEQVFSSNEKSAAIAMPANLAEENIVGVIGVVLGLEAEAISMDQSFVGLGGDSITAMQVSARCRSSGMLVTVKDVLLSKSIRQIAANAKVATQGVEELARGGNSFSLLSDLDIALLDQEARKMGLAGLSDLEDGYPVSGMQQGILIAQAQASNTYKFYVICEVGAARGDTQLTLEKFQTAWQRVVNRHAILRTVFVESASKNGLFDQFVLKNHSPRVAFVQTFDELVQYPYANPINYEEKVPSHRLTLAEAGDKLYFNLEISHTLIDGASMAMILRDLAAAYEQELPTGPLYGDYISYLSQQSSEESLAYWKKYLAGAEPCTFPALNGQVTGAKTLEAVNVTIPESIVQGLQEFSRSEGVTISNVFQTAWALVIRAFTSSPDVMFGYLASGRDIPVAGVEEAVGPYINMLVCRVDASNNVKISDSIKRIQSDYFDCLPHQHVSLAEIQHSVGFNSTRMFNTILSLQRPMSEGIESNSAVSINYLQGNDPTEYDLGVNITADDKTVEASINYWSTYLTQYQAEQVAASFTKILGQMVQQPKATLAEIDLISDADRDNAFRWNNNGVAPAKVEELIHANVTRWVSKQPNAPAVAAWDGEMTYSELEDKSNRLAHFLRSLGVTTEVKVPLCFDKSMFTVIAMLGMLKAGGAYTSMDPSHPPQHHENIVRETSAKVVLTGSAAYAEKLKDIVERVVVVDESFLNELPAVDEPPSEEQVPDGAAFICFTSGSTGKPKAICLTHSSFVSMISHNEDMDIKPGTRVFQFAAYTFDTSNSEIFGPLISGACVCIPSEWDRLNDLAGAMNSLNVNWTFMTPSMASAMQPADLPSLKLLALNGEQARDDIVNLWKDHVRVVNSYGPAECTIWTSMSNLGYGNSPATISRGNGGCGSLMWCADIMDVNKLAPIGAVGELLIEGPILARGYLDAEKTAQAFIRAPEWRGPGFESIRMYKSGDLVRYHKDGTLVYVGRKDGQIKLNGQRIEMGEIERHIASHDLIRHAVVLFPKKGICKRKLVTVVAPLNFTQKTMASSEPRPLTEASDKKEAAAQIAEVKEQLRDLVPGYMVPSVWLMAEAFPLTASKKVDRVRVARWVEEITTETYVHALDVEEEQYENENMTSEETHLQTIVATVLNISVETVYLNRSFLNLGGDSILAMQLVVACRKEGLRITVRDVMRSRTISSLALTVKAAESGSLRQEEVFDVPFKLSPIQSVYFTDLTRGSTDVAENQFNQSFFLKVSKKQSNEVFAKAIEEIVKQHSMLRARYRKGGNGVWSQLVLSKAAGAYRFRIHDVQSREDAEKIAEAAQGELNIQNGPVFSAELFNISGGAQFLFLVAHHLVIDLVSWRVMIRQLEEVITTDAPLSGPKPFPFHSWLQMQSTYAEEDLSPETSLPYGVPAADYDYWGMADRPNLRGETTDGEFVLSKTETDLLLRGCHTALKTEALDIFLAAAFQSFATTFERSPPAIFNEGHGREPWDSQLDITETIGWFTTMFPVHVAAEKTKDLLQTVMLVKDQRKSIPRNGWAYFNSRHSNEGGKAAFANHLPFEVQFNYLGVYQGQGQSTGLLQIVPFNKGDVGPRVNRFALFDINVYVMDGEAHFAFSYNVNMNHQDKIKSWINQYQRTVVDMAHALEQSSRILTPGDFPLLPTNQNTLQKFQNETLPQVKIEIDNIEDIFAVSPMQEGILLSQNRMQGAYQIQTMVEVIADGKLVDAGKLANAWQAVVQRHATLRTLFVQKLSDRPFDQIVLKNFEGRSSILDEEDDKALARLQSLKPLDYAAAIPPHRVSIVKTKTGRVFAKLEISHALVDGASMGVIISEWVSAYQEQLPSIPGPLYSDYISYIQSQPKGKALDFWKSSLADVRPCQFPLLTDNETQPERHLRNIDIQLPSAGKIRDFCQQNNITLASIFRLAWAAVLRAYTGDDQVCFGYLASGREIPVPGIETAIGAFINMLVCSLDFNRINKKRAVHCLEELQDEYLKSLPFQHTSLAEIQHELGLSGQPLFNTVLSFQRRAHRDFKMGDILLRYLDGVDPTEYDLSVSVADSEEGIHVHMSYLTTRLSDGQAANVANTFSTSIASILQAPHSKIESLDLLSARDEEQVATWNQEIPAPIEQCVHEIFHNNAQKTPDAMAIESWDGNFTYRELDIKTTQLAHELVQMGVKVDQLIPIAFEKSAWALVSMLAIMKAGAGYVPLDPAHPNDRLMTIISQTESDLVLASEATSERMKKLVGRVLTVSPSSAAWSSKPAAEVKTSVNHDNVAYTLFTSGSTGVPKGVVLSHLAVSSSITHHGAMIKCSPDTRMYQFAAYTFDACILEIFTTLAYGGCICVPSDAERMSDIAGFINRYRVNTSFMTPSLVRILTPSQIPTMTTLILGGEALGKDNIETWANETRLMNGYGPTETCVFAVMKTFESPKDRNDILGTAVGAQSWIVQLNDPSKLAPVGAVGMLYLSGATVARGYLNDKAKTDSVFLENPAFLSKFKEGKQRVYNTGDLARYNSDGTITYLGRRDTQVKLRGQRIELAEIEHHTKANFAEAAQIGVEVVLPQGQKERATLAAFLCLPNQTEDSSMFLPLSATLRDRVFELQKVLATLLPPYEIPSLYIPVGKTPTTTAGKLDRKTLREAIAQMSDDELAAFSLSEGSKRPLTTEAEKRLASLWSEVLKISLSQIGADDSFFRMGGDSIMAMRLAAQSTEDFSLSVSDVFQTPTLSEMALIAGKNLTPVATAEDLLPFSLLGSASLDEVKKNLASKCDVSESQVEDCYPCTPLQEGLMVLSVLNPGAYMAQKVFKLPSSMDISEFKKAWEIAAANNPVLRTAIVQTESSQAMQVVLKDVFEWRTAATVEEYLQRDQQDEAAYGKLLSRYAITEDNHFVWTAHHSMYDGWTVPLILEQVQSAYSNGSAPTPSGFNRFIKYLSTTSEAESQAYWEQYLAGEKPSSFPEEPSASHKLRVDQQVHHSISISRQKGSEVPMATVLRAAWGMVLSHYADASDIVFGVTLSGRNCPVPDVAKMLGPTITTVPVRMTLPSEGTVSSFLQCVQGDATNMIPFEHFGLQNISKVSTEAARAIQFQNLFVVQPMAQFDVHHNEVLGAEEVPMPLTNFDTYPLIMECSLSDKEVHFEARFDKAIISSDRVERMLKHFEHVIRVLNNASDSTKMNEISMFSERDMNQILAWNEQYPETLETTVPEVFAEQVKSRPNALAVDAWDGQFTYAEIDELSTLFAHRLVEEGVGPDVLVPLCFEKSRWAVATQMAIMKAGGGCVNLDPAHPLQRLELIIEDAGAKVLLLAPQFYDKFSEVEGLKILSIDEAFYRNLQKNAVRTPALPTIDPSNTAYVLFTSGSTGRPKGIVIEHRALCSSSKAHGTTWDIGPNTRLLQFAAYTFDVSCADIFTTLQRGGCICVPSENQRLNDLAGAINQFKCNWAFLTPTVASLLPANDIPSLRKLVLGGEASTRDTIAKWHNVLDLIVCYGPAECSVYCSGAPPATATSDPADLGEAIGALYWIADPNDYNRLVPIGCAGELLLEGPTVARGYLHDKEKTAKAFVSNPIWAKGGTEEKPRRFYRTGDLVRFNGDGTIHFVGRKDLQVKIRGQRVELGEIEHAIRTHMPNLAHVTVDAVRQSSLGNRQAVVAFLHETNMSGPAKAMPLTDHLRDSLTKLQRSLSETLPSYMVPSLFIPMEQVPLTMNGKANRKALRDLASSFSREETLEYGLESSNKQQPTTEMEFMLRDLWAWILAVEPETIGTADQFFRLGGDSILAMKLVGAAAEKGLPLSVKDFFRHPVLLDMAREIESRASFVAKDAPSYEPFTLIKDTHPSKLVAEMAAQLNTTRANIMDVLPATDFQQNAVAHAITKNRGFRNYLWLDGDGAQRLEIESAKKALGIFVSKHEILRTIFALHNSKIVQVVLNQLDFAVDVHETSKDIADFTESLCRADAQLPTKLTDPLLKFILVTHACNNQHRIIMRISHAQYDGVCLPRVWGSLVEAFEGKQSSESSKPMSAYLQGLDLLNKEESFGYWRTLLRGSKMTDLVAHNRPSYSNIYNTVTKRNVPTLSLSSHGITFATILKAGWSLVLSSLAGSSDVVFGHVVSGRNMDVAEIEKIVGGCINIVPVRSILKKGMTNLELLQNVQAQHAASLPHESVGTQTIVKECTAWPNYTRMSSIVQHQNIVEETAVAMNGNQYKVDFFCPEADEADLAIKTTPLKDGTTEVLMITSDRAINESTRTLIMDSLCDAIKALCTEPEAPVNAYFEKKLTKTVFPLAQVANGSAANGTNGYMNGVNGHTNGTNGRSDSPPRSVASRIRGWETIKSKNTTKQSIITAWQEVLGMSKDRSVRLDDDSDFFELGGDLVSAAILATTLEMKGVGKVTVEDVIDNSTLEELVDVVSTKF